MTDGEIYRLSKWNAWVDKLSDGMTDKQRADLIKRGIAESISKPKPKAKKES